MRLFSLHKVGQSRQELVAAALFSFIIHGLLLAAALFISMIRMPLSPVPVSYQVALVHAPLDAPPQTAPAPPQPAPTKLERKQPPAMKAPPAALSKNAMPELGRSKKALKKTEQPQPTEAPSPGVKSTSTSAVSAPVGPAAKTESVVVSAPQDPRLGDYWPRVKNKIEPNWHPPKGVRGTKAKVLFQILRAGRVGVVKLQESSGNFYFDQAAIRAIQSSGPFPPLPDDFPRELADFSVDLTLEE